MNRKEEMKPPTTWEELMRWYNYDQDQKRYTVDDIKTALITWMLNHGRETVYKSYQNDTVTDVLWGDFAGDYLYTLLDTMDEEGTVTEAGAEYFKLSPTGEYFFNKLGEA